jgi:hypothetical protein
MEPRSSCTIYGPGRVAGNVVGRVSVVSFVAGGN